MEGLAAFLNGLLELCISENKKGEKHAIRNFHRENRERRGKPKEGEGKAEGKIQLLQELLGLRVMTDDEFESMSPEQLADLLVSLRQQFDAR